jgi:membrane-bound ClpP family serine protease
MVLILGILAVIVAIVLWVAKAAIVFVTSFGVIGIVAAIVGLVLLSRSRRSSI